MEALQAEYRKNGYNYSQVYRDDMVAIYEQRDKDRLIAYEVCEIITAEAGEVFGKMIGEREKLPSTEQWGKKAFTVRTLEQAHKKADEMKERIVLHKEQKVKECDATKLNSSNTADNQK